MTGTSFKKTCWETSLRSADPGDGSNNTRVVSSASSLQLEKTAEKWWSAATSLWKKLKEAEGNLLIQK